MGDKIQIHRIKSFPLDHASMKYAKQIVAQDGVNGMVIMPDTFTKDKYLGLNYKITIPSSVMITTDADTLYPQFRSRGINCGMMIVSLPFTKDELTDEIIESLFKRFLFTIPYYTSHRLRMPLFSEDYDLSMNDFYDVLERGPRSVADKHDSPIDNLNAMEFGGTFKEVDLDKVRKFFRPEWLTDRTVRLRHSFGRYFGGNHYFEIQEVVENTSGTIPLQKGQLVVLLHTGCQSVEDVLRNDIKDKYIKKDTYIKVDASEEAYDAFFSAQDVIMNYGHAYRYTTFQIIYDWVKEVFGGDKKAHIIIEKSHNYVSCEKVSGDDALVYRHNAESLTSGGHAILSGDFNHPSYIVEGMQGIDRMQNSIDHGLGKILEQNKDRNEETGENVQVYRFKKGINTKWTRKKVDSPIMKNKATEEYFDLMRKESLLKPVVSFRPILNIKHAK